MITYIFITLLLSFLMLAYFKTAVVFNIIDKPGARSSHQKPTIRGGGILFLFAAIIWIFFRGFETPYAVAGLFLIGIISFMDDIKSQSGYLRILIHFTAIGLLFYEIGLWNMHGYLLLAAIFLTVGWINAFNFMDGINAMLTFNSFVTLGTFSLLNNANRLIKPVFQNTFPAEWTSFFPGGLIGAIFISLLIFGFYNVRRQARVFSGDVGSITMAFLQSWIMLQLMIETRNAYWLLFFAVYGIDTSVTLFMRMIDGENITKAHRKHLYQLMSNELKMPHIFVSSIYAIIQLIINIITIALFFTGNMNWFVFAIILMTLLFVYFVARSKIRHAINRNKL
jgi:UDP-GlcNAc:undecaprenyl-phosphate GlcNAc-1-phosphate transferase